MQRQTVSKIQMMGAGVLTARLLWPWVGKAGLPESPREVKTLHRKSQSTFIDNIIAQLLHQSLMMILILLEAILRIKIF